MKRFVALLAVAVMLLSLCGCASEEAQLYEKYAGIIDMLEAKDYQGAMREITAMALDEQKGDVEEVPVMQILCDTWTTTHEDAPKEMTFNEDGSCIIDGQAMSWLAEEGDAENTLRAYILEDGEYRYFLWLETSDYYAVPLLQLSYVRERDDYIEQGDHIGNYYNHPMLPTLMVSWRAISDYERVVADFWIDSSEMNIDGQDYDWTIVESEDPEHLTIHAEGQNGAEGTYTMTLSMRDGYPVVTVTDDASGDTGLYYTYNYGYDRNWVEYRYVVAKNYLENYLNNGDFWCNETETSYNNNTAVPYLYDLFTALGDYGDAPQILEDWNSVLFNQAARYLQRYVDNGYFYVDDVEYEDSEALAYVYDLLTEIADHEPAAEELARISIVRDVYLKATNQYTDNMGNVSGVSTQEYLEYNELGQVVRLNNYGKLQRMYGTYSSNAYYTYDDAGVVTEIKIGYTDDVDALVTPAYDANGNKISEHVVNNDGEFDITHTYDEQNRLIETRRPNSYDNPENYYYFWNYTYDESGKQVQQVYGYVYNGELDWEYINVYTYDAAGNMTAETETYNSYSWNGELYSTYTHTAECICDDQGRVIQKNWTYGNTVYSSGTEDRPSNATSVYNYTYGDVYFYDAPETEDAE